MTEKNNLRPIIIIFIIITFFIFLVSFLIFYATENFSVSCGCLLPPWVTIVSTASFGLFVGLTIYYLISKNFMEKKQKAEKSIMKIFDILNPEEGKVLRILIENKGEINQSALTKCLDTNKVKISRIISRMERKGIIKKDRMGMTNKIVLCDDLKKYF